MRWLEAVLGLLYRERCAGCGAWGPSPLCRACLAGWPAWPEGGCPICAEPGGSCAPCTDRQPAFAGTVAAGAYRGVAKSAIQALKFKGRRRLAPLLAARLAEAPGFPSGDWLLVPVPLHPERRRKRGFNQAALIAREVARARQLPWREAIERTLATDPQHVLDRRSRLANLDAAFRCRESLAGRRVLLVDDVMTTGATAQAAALALLAAGAEEVRVLVVARTLPPGYAS